MNYLNKAYYFILFYFIYSLYFIYNWIWCWFFFFFNPCFNIEQINDIVIASEIYHSVSRNCVDLNELPNDGENNDICGEELVVWNEYPMEEIGVIDLLLVNVFLVKKRLSFSIKKLSKLIWFYNSKRSFCHKKWRKCKTWFLLSPIKKSGFM